jgi:hypothetical protein
MWSNLPFQETVMLFVYIFVALILALLFITALMPKMYSVERTIIINKSVKDVMTRIGNLNEYALWNPWQQADPAAKKQ